MGVRRQYHGGLTSGMLVAFTTLLGVGAINSQNNLLFLAFGLAVGAGVVSGVLSGAMMMRVRVERRAPGAGGVGRPSTFRYALTNTGRWLPAFALRVEETSWDPVPTGGGWRRQMPTPRAFAAYIPAGATIELDAGVTPSRRGEAHLSAVRVSSGFPFGLVRKSCTFEQHSTFEIHPRVVRLRPEVAANLTSRADVGKTSASRRGRGDEFYGLRDYSPGDSPRSIAWRVSARTGSLVVRENTAPAAGHLWVVLNLAGPGLPDAAGEARVEDAVTLAASLLQHAAGGGMEPGLMVVDRGVSVAPGSGARHMLGLMSALARLKPGGSPAGRAQGGAAPDASRGACVVVHAHAVDPTIGPHGARHVSAADLRGLLVRSDAAPVDGAPA